jgi:hypothetical protein
MRNLDKVAEQLFNEIRGRYPSVTIGDAEGNVTSAPSLARFYEFDFKSQNTNLGKVSISLDETSGVTIMYNKDFTNEVGHAETKDWYEFLRHVRMFSKKRLLNFEVRDINKTNFTKRDYADMAATRGETQMAESKMYGTHKTSFQKFGNAKLSIKHTDAIGEGESRNKKIGSLFIENTSGEKFKYPFKHLSGARAMAIHVSEGGHPYDDFGKHITGLSEELSNLRKFKTYMGRSSVMAESLAEHMGTVNERMVAVKKRIQTLQKPTMYKEAFEEFVVIEDTQVPEDVQTDWIDQLTIKQFNEDLKDVFPYIYKLVSEASATQDLSFDDIMAETAPETSMRPQARPTSMRPQARPEVHATPALAQRAAETELASQPNQMKQQFEKGVDYKIVPAQGGFTYQLAPEVNIGASPSGGTRGIGGAAYESNIDAAYDKLLGQFSDNFNAQVEGEEVVSEFQALNSKPIDKTGRVQGTNIFIQRDGTQGSKPDTGYDENDPTMSDKIAAGEKAARGGAPAASKNFQAATSSSGGDLGGGFKSVKVDAFGKTDIPAVHDVQGNIYIMPNNGYVRSPAKYVIVKDGQPFPEANPGPMTMKALQAAGLAESFGESTEQKTPLGEFILSFYDREQGVFPKGETAILTMVEKDYGDRYIKPASKFIERLGQVFEKYQVAKISNIDRIQELAGLR